MLIVRWLVRIVAALVIGIALLFVAARFHDGPLGIIPGGALASGEVVTEPVADWTFARDVGEVELQLDSESGSRTVWILVHEGRAYVPASLSFPPGKRWHRRAAEDGRATLRVQGRRYPVELVKTDDPSLSEPLSAEVARKYGMTPDREGGIWIFRVAPRTAG